MIKKTYQILKFFFIILACLGLSHSSINAAIIVVNSTGDDPAANPAISPLTAGNVITVRSAIQYANAIGGSNTINFNIVGMGPFVIFVGTGTGVTGQALPVIISQLNINGYSQTGSLVATSTTNANIQIILNGSAVNTGAFQDGLTLNVGSDNSIIHGLVIQGFPENGINIQGGTGQAVRGNYIGTNQAGTLAVSNLGNGVNIGLSASSVIIGSLGVADRNVISGQQFTTGATPVSGAGVFIAGSNNQVVGNYIGTNASGTNPISNRVGVYVYSATQASLNNSIQNNIIAFNNGTAIGEGAGVTIDGANNNSILANSIFANQNSGVVTNGITLINNGNDNLGSPTMTSAVISGTTLILGGNFSSLTNPNSQFIIQFFVNPAIGSTAPGQTFVGQAIGTTDLNGNANFSNVRLFSNAVANGQISATITLLSGTGIPLSTSPYSLNFVLAQGQAAGSIDTTITFATFPGIKAQSVVIDSAGRVIVGGLDGSIVRYNTSGTIDLTYTAFPGTAVKAMVIDGNDNIIAVGTEGSVVKYNSAGTINSVFSAFPGILANSVIFDEFGDIIVGGLQSTIVRYSNSGTTIGTITTTFDAFSGTEVNGLALDSLGRIIACGLQGQVVRYMPDGVVDIIYQAFPGQAANAVTIDSNDNAIVVGKTKVTTSTASGIGVVPIFNPITMSTGFAQVPISTVVSSTNVVRYDTDGNIELTFAAFNGLNAQDVLIDLNGNIIVCGIESLIVQYNPTTGNINFTFAAFPGISTTWMALTSANQIVAVGWEGEVIRYFN